MEIDGGIGSHGGLRIHAEVETVGRTGVEMEALTGVMGAAVSAFDMCKAVDKGMVIGEVKVLKKEGGRTGRWEGGVNVEGGYDT